MLGCQTVRSSGVSGISLQLCDTAIPLSASWQISMELMVCSPLQPSITLTPPTIWAKDRLGVEGCVCVCACMCTCASCNCVCECVCLSENLFIGVKYSITPKSIILYLLQYLFNDLPSLPIYTRDGLL